MPPHLPGYASKKFGFRPNDAVESVAVFVSGAHLPVISMPKNGTSSRGFRFAGTYFTTISKPRNTATQFGLVQRGYERGQTVIAEIKRVQNQ